MAQPLNYAALATERHYSVQQVADMWGISAEKVRLLFRNEPGVLKLSAPAILRNRKHKPHELLRIPASVLARLHQERSAVAPFKVQPGRRII